MATCAPGTRLSAAIFAFSAAERLRRPVGPSITSSRLTRLAFETSNWTSILPSAIMLLPCWSEVSFAPSCHAPHEGISEAHTFRVRLQRAFPPGFERARSAVGVGSVAAPERLSRRHCLDLPHSEAGKPRKYHIPDRPPVSAEALLAEGKW